MSLEAYKMYQLFSVLRINTPATEPGDIFPHMVGIELEIENNTAVPIIPGWRPVPDASLRDGIEYVLTEPFNGAKLRTAIDKFYAADFRYTNGPRTSTHIHLDMTNSGAAEARAQFALIYGVEQALFRIVDDNRKWAGYCMPLSEMSPSRVCAFMRGDNEMPFIHSLDLRNVDKYYGYNIMSLRKHGTAELRYFTGGPSKEQLVDWVRFAQELKSAGQTYSLDQILSVNTEEEADEFIRRAFPTWGGRLLAVGGAYPILRAWNDLGAMICEDDGAQRAEQLVFISPALKRFYCNRVLKTPANISLFEQRVEPLQVMTNTEFRRLIHGITSNPRRPSFLDYGVPASSDEEDHDDDDDAGDEYTAVDADEEDDRISDVAEDVGTMSDLASNYQPVDASVVRQLEQYMLGDSNIPDFNSILQTRRIR